MAPRPVADAALPLTPAKKEAAKSAAAAVARLALAPPPATEPAELERITLEDLDDEEREQMARDGEWIPPRRSDAEH